MNIHQFSEASLVNETEQDLDPTEAMVLSVLLDDLITRKCDERATEALIDHIGIIYDHEPITNMKGGL